MKHYTIFDHAEKSVVYNTATGTPEQGYRNMKVKTFRTKKEAERYKDDYLAAGNYPDKPHTVLEIISHY